MDTTKQNGSWIGGLLLIGLGAVFLLQNLTGFDLGNWWAVFVLLPGVAALARGYGFFQADRGFSPRVTGSFVGGGVLTLLGMAFLFDLDLRGIWPLFLILIGTAILLRRPSARAAPTFAEQLWESFNRSTWPWHSGSSWMLPYTPTWEA